MGEHSDEVLREAEVEYVEAYSSIAVGGPAAHFSINGR
jgi:hypothetical protein